MTETASGIEILIIEIYLLFFEIFNTYLNFRVYRQALISNEILIKKLIL